LLAPENTRSSRSAGAIVSELEDDLRQPGPERSRISQLAKVLVRFQQRLGQHILGILAVSAGMDHLPVNRVLMLVRKGSKFTFTLFIDSSGSNVTPVAGLST
jgi:hypothetical protein